MILDRQEFDIYFDTLSKDPIWGEGENAHHYYREHPDPLVTYTNIDWKSVDDKLMVKMAYPIGSELGGIYSEEALYFILLVKEYKLKTLVEIGTMAGVSTRLFAALASRYDGHVYSIDGNANKDVQLKLDVLKLSKYVDLIPVWSPWLGFIPDWNIDLLFIDGDHSYMSVLVDYHYFNYFANKGAIIAFHDSNIEDIPRAIEEICKRDPLKKIGEAGRLLVYQKLGDRQEKYFQILKRK
jgi:predicted O-methyltransferase YrrM